ncbi:MULTISPECIES: MalM family protein [Halomonadaceae]|uniref:Maltose operon protein n=1 Tax=Onishia taeanensis TaxID=284577 RepID=A0A328XYR4_9GAMM|nr:MULTISPECIES: MalM family protein [Halomonas]RAR60997.1 maltose operon protein [Halomonas taeanensis]
MYADKWLAMGLLATLLSGCALAPEPVEEGHVVSTDWLAQSPDCCQGLADLPPTAMQLETRQVLVFDADTPVHAFASGKSPFHALDLPTDVGPVQVEVTSEVMRDRRGSLEVIAPTLLLLDREGRVQRRLDWQAFDYRPSRGLAPDRLTASLGINPSVEAARLVVLTTSEALAATTEVLHPSRARAQARHLADPALTNPRARHVARGEVVLRVSVLGEQGRWSKTRPAGASLPPAVTEGSALDGLAIRRLIRAALKADDIDLAMALAERAEGAGETGTRAWLAEQLRVR